MLLLASLKYFTHKFKKTPKQSSEWSSDLIHIGKGRIPNVKCTSSELAVSDRTEL